MDEFTNIPKVRSLAEWRQLPDDVLAGIYEEIVEWREQDRADQHWAWPFVQPYLDDDQLGRT